MAKTNYGGGVAELRRSISNTTYSRNHYGAYSRLKKGNPSPSTTRQAAGLSALAATNGLWRSLSEAQRQQWIIFAASFPRLDIFGMNKPLSGVNLFKKLNSQLLLIGESTISVPPALSDLPVLSDLSATISLVGTSYVLSSSTLLVPGSVNAKVYATRSISPGISNANSYFGVIKVIPHGNRIDGSDIFSDYLTFYPAPGPGTKIFTKIIFVNRSSGIQSPAMSCVTIVSV